ncbi:ABC transporter permease [Nocardiopsis sp. MG754419]|uniref:ABC transporter permease n=1 Tax=Nocardiopsis sp. MG754419 TaxID=2259865 RepID=UPI001BAD4311|nr:ABC transporter permease [Nocardiopsis sp. MG754419]MBR8745041.1 ABC transporter permease [Nocardiopsis sp. MG754419]
MIRTAVTLEVHKSRRLRVGVLCLVMVASVVALAGMNLFSDATRAGFSDPAAQPWEALLLNQVLMTAMTAPILVAVLAGRQVDIEHQGRGWTLARVAGFGPGTLCRAKAVVLGVVLTLTTGAQSVLLLGAGLAAGITVAPPLALWGRYTFCLVLVNLALLCLHLWLAARVEHQLVGLGVGLLGAFYAVFSLLMPVWAAYLLPWGYYAAISPLAMSGDHLVRSGPVPWLLALFLGAAATLFLLACRRLDRSEGGPA